MRHEIALPPAHCSFLSKKFGLLRGGDLHSCERAWWNQVRDEIQKPTPDRDWLFRCVGETMAHEALYDYMRRRMLREYILVQELQEGFRYQGVLCATVVVVGDLWQFEISGRTCGGDQSWPWHFGPKGYAWEICGRVYTQADAEDMFLRVAAKALDPRGPSC